MEMKNSVEDASHVLESMDSLSYQKIDLGDGITTGGDDRSYLVKLALDEDMRGKTLLDIGSFLGYFCIEASKRGGVATGIETDPSNYVNAKKIASHLGHEIEYIKDDFEKTKISKKFDVILCLNVLHHLFDPIGSIRKIINMSSGRILIEYCPASFREVFKLTRNPFSFLLNFFPIIFLGDDKKNVMSRSYLFSDKSLRGIFNTHTELFEPVKISHSPFKGRKILEAHRRKIKHLIVIAGPTSVGKSTFCRKFLAGEVQPIDGVNPEDWRLVAARDLRSITRHPENILFHYDMMRPWGTSMRSYSRDPKLDLLQVAEKVSVITLVCPQKTLLERHEAVVKGGKARNKRHKRLLKNYQHRSFVDRWYRDWFNFLEAHKDLISDSKILVTEENYAAVDPDRIASFVSDHFDGLEKSQNA